MRDDAEHEGAVRDRPTAVVVFDEADRLTDQRGADVDRVAVPSDLAIVAHPPDRMIGSVTRLTQNAVEAPRRDDVVLGRRVVAERLVRSFVVVEPLEAAQSLDPLAQAARRRIGGVAQQRQMQPLQPSVLLRLARRDALRHDAGLDHLDGKLRQPAGPAQGKRRSIVGAQPIRQAELTEGRAQHRPHMIRISARHRLAAQQIAAVGIAQRQRLATAAITGDEPALEVDAPNIIRRCAMPKRCARWRAAPPQTALDRQTLAVTQCPNRAWRRPRRPRPVRLKPSLGPSPAPSSDAHANRNAAPGDLFRQRSRCRYPFKQSS